MDEEPCILEYARFHGLAREHRIDAFDVQSILNWHTNASSDLLADPKNAPTISIAAEFPENEKLSLDTDARAFLASIIGLQEDLPFDVLDHCDVRQAKELRLETPLLRTDHELDVRSFGRKLPRTFGTVNLPFAGVVDENDEGFSWPTKFQSLLFQVGKWSRSEKLAMPRPTVAYLTSAISDEYTALDDEETIAQDLIYRRKSALEAATPPLFPPTPPVIVPAPSSPIPCLSLLSENTSSIAAEAQALEDRFMEADAVNPWNKDHRACEEGQLLDSDGIEHLYSAAPNSPFPIGIAKLKVEGPLTPSATVVAPKKISLSDPVEQIVARIPNCDSRKEQDMNSDDDFEALLNDFVKSAAYAMNRELEREQLQEVNLTRRIDVPIMDFSVPGAPWKTAGRTLDREEIKMMVQKAWLSLHQWTGMGKVERELPWSPFSLELGQVGAEEHIADVGLVNIFVDGIGFAQTIDNDSLTWKPEGLRILDNSDDEDEDFQSATSGRAGDFQSLLRKRKLEINEKTQIADQTPAVKHILWEAIGRDYGTVPPTTVQKDLDLVLLECDAPKIHLNNVPLFGGTFTASDELNRFMEMQGQDAKRLKVTGHPISYTAPDRTPKLPGRVETGGDQWPTFKLASQNVEPLPAPSMTSSSTPRPIIVSSAILKQQRQLIRYIAQLYPAAELMERKFTARARQLEPSSKLNQPDSLDLEEADITISPSTGIICTTVQKIKQKPLPGQASSPGVRERTMSIAPRYERLLLLVSAGKRSATTSEDPDERDVEAIAELTIFATTLEHGIFVIFIAGANEEMARWVVGLLTTSPPLREGFTLLPDETLWELFLRRAGMNSFAAQVVLSELMPPDGDVDMMDCSNSFQSASSPGRTGSIFGLSAFVRMEVGERLRKFEALLGGRKALLRVSDVVDMGWTGL